MQHSMVSEGETQDDQSSGEARPQKKQRRSVDDVDNANGSVKETFRRQLSVLLAQGDGFQIDEIAPGAGETYHALTEEQQCQVFQILSKICCDDEPRPLPPGSAPEPTEDLNCSTCDQTQSSDLGDRLLATGSEDVEVLDLLDVLLPQTHRSIQVKLLATIACQRLLAHTSSSKYLDISGSNVGSWCLHSLGSPSRDCRILATACVKHFVTLRSRRDYELVRKNRRAFFEYVHKLWTKAPPLQETAIFVFSQMAMVCGEEELNIVLQQFVEFLGHPNAYISGLVYGELQKLARNMKSTPAALLRPFWRTITPVVVKNLQSTPMIAQSLCDFFGANMTVDSLLVLTEEYALPYLVYAGKKDVVQRIALAHGATVSPFDLCTKKKNLAAILAYLFRKLGQEPEGVIMSRLADMSPQFQTHDLAKWIKLEPILIACELLKAIVDSAGLTDSGAYKGLQLLAQLDIKGSSKPPGYKKKDAIAIFLEHHVLGIVTLFNAIFNDSQARCSDKEKHRCLAAIGQLVKLGGSRISRALPQICASLRSALENEDLCDKAFESWAKMIRSLPEEDIELLIDQTLAYIVRNWDKFLEATKKIAYDLVEELWRLFRHSLDTLLGNMPSLSGIAALEDFEGYIKSVKEGFDERVQLLSFSERLKSENSVLVEQALAELLEVLNEKADWLYQALLREQPEPAIASLTRSLLDCCVASHSNNNILLNCGKALGKIGCLDPNHMETTKEKRSVVAYTNFSYADETEEFIMFFLEEVLIKAFLTAPNTRTQGFLAFAMQELLRICGIDEPGSHRSRAATKGSRYRGWADLDKTTKNMLTPFLTSRYSFDSKLSSARCSYPLFTSKEMTHREWLEAIVLDLLEGAPGDNIGLIFEACRRIIRSQDISIPMFLLPYAALNLFVTSSHDYDEAKQNLLDELISILQQPLTGQKESVTFCSQRVFDILDYMSKWLQQRRSFLPADRGMIDLVAESARVQIERVEEIIRAIPPALISTRAIECKEYSRALFHWEQYMQQVKAPTEEPSDEALARLQEIYAQIDEPDGIEGISAQMHTLTIDQQALEHRKAGEWGAAQSWYEIQLQSNHQDAVLQSNLLTCLMQAGETEAVLNQYRSLDTTLSYARVVPFAVEAAWTSGNWAALDSIVNDAKAKTNDFNVSIGSVLQALREDDQDYAEKLLTEIRIASAASLTAASTSSLQSCHDILFRLHVLEDLDMILHTTNETEDWSIYSLEQRLKIVGSDVSTKHYLLSLRQAAVTLSPHFSQSTEAATWVAIANLSRKSSLSRQAHVAILHAMKLGDSSTTITHAKLMWQNGQHRKAIQYLRGAIDSGAFVSQDDVPNATQAPRQTDLLAKAHLMLATWLDSAGQTQSDVIQQQYRKATDFRAKWDKGWYALAKHHNKILDSDKASTGKQSQFYLSGESTKIVIENYLRALRYGSNKVYEIMPKVLTLWMDLVAGLEQPSDSVKGSDRFVAHLLDRRKKIVKATNEMVKTYLVDRLRPFQLYTVFSQIVARIGNTAVWEILALMAGRVVWAFPQQALWAILALEKAHSKARRERGIRIFQHAIEFERVAGTADSLRDLRLLISHARKLTVELLRIADFDLKDNKAAVVSLSRDLKFNHKLAPSRLVIPTEAQLIPSMPTRQDGWPPHSYHAFAKDPVTIVEFEDASRVLASLQRPRKLTLRGSDGNLYSVLAKPKDDLRKDQRLMEFDTMINRFLKRDVDASRRKLYIRTYAVVPLNEECGLIEWIDNLKTFRDILLKLYKNKGISTNYSAIRQFLEEACQYDDDRCPQLFEHKVLAMFPPVFRDWFVENFPAPSAWFAARLRYTRSAAIMSIVGHVLGLGDRHGENILFEQGSGGTLHVDFNCLFDKGLTFDKPEQVPFRLTHNMVDAMGAYGSDGPFRRSFEITLRLLREHHDALMTSLEAFLHDPTTDFLPGKKRKSHAAVPDTPQEVLDGVRAKVRGMLEGESVPLSVEGYTDQMIGMATDKARLARMYIGWCAFF